MGKFDSLKRSLSSAADKAKEAAKDAGNKLKNVDFKEVVDKTTSTVKNAADNIQDSIKNFDASSAKDSVTDMFKKGGDALKQHFENAKETDQKVKMVLQEAQLSKDKVLPEDALKMIYLLMLADERVSEEEIQRFNSIVPEFDLKGECSGQKIVDECNSLIVASNRRNYMDFVSDGIQDALFHSKQSGKGTIDKKLLLWNMLAVAYSDGEYSENEKTVLDIISRRMEIDPSMILEMEAAVSTLDALMKQEDSFKNSNKPYSVINTNIAEIEYRRNTIMQSVRELIED